MLSAPLRPCRTLGCPEAVPGGGHCEQHQRERNSKPWKGKGTTTERGYGTPHQKVRLLVFGDAQQITYPYGGPLCYRCRMKGRITVATQMHHRNHNAHDRSPENLESICIDCHREGEREEVGH